MQTIASTPGTVISGGQTGVDRAALDWAIENGVNHAGWCPAGRIAADGALDKRYQLTETESAGYRQRTKRNVQDSDATLIIYRETLEGGSQLTLTFVEKQCKPFFLLNLTSSKQDVVPQCQAWLAMHNPHKLNVAGPSEAHCPGIYQQTLALLNILFLGQSITGGPSTTDNQNPSSHPTRTTLDTYEDH